MKLRNQGGLRVGTKLRELMGGEGSYNSTDQRGL